MRYAETGYNLEIDLTRGNIERVETDPRDTELYRLQPHHRLHHFAADPVDGIFHDGGVLGA